MDTLRIVFALAIAVAFLATIFRPQLRIGLEVLVVLAVVLLVLGVL